MRVQNHTQATRGSPDHIEDCADNTNRQQDHAMPVAGHTTGSASAANASSTRSSARCPSGSASSAVAAFASACRASSRRSCRSWKLCRKKLGFLEFTLRVRQQCGCRVCQRLPRLLLALLPLLEARRQCLGLRFLIRSRFNFTKSSEPEYL